MNRYKIYLLIGMTVNMLMQFWCSYYIKKHPELFSNNPNPYILKPKDIEPFSLYSLWKIDRINGINVIRFFQPIYSSNYRFMFNFLKQSLLIGLGLRFISYMFTLPNGTLAQILYQSSAQNLPGKSMVSIELMESTIKNIEWVCNNEFEFLVAILNDESIPFKIKEKVTSKILLRHINFKTDSERIEFVLCMVTVLFSFWIVNPGGYMILLHKLYEAKKAGKISKVVYRAILYKLRKNGVIDIDFL